MSAGRVNIYAKLELSNASMWMEHTHVAVILAILELEAMNTVEVRLFNRRFYSELISALCDV